MLFLIRFPLMVFLLNFLWEVGHSRFYKGYKNLEFHKFFKKMLKASLGDCFWVCFFFTLAFYNTFLSFIIWKWVFFLFFCLMGAYAGEKTALNAKRWKYTKKMPLVLGVGLTPFIQLVLTGVLGYVLVSYF